MFWSIFSKLLSPFSPKIAEITKYMYFSDKPNVELELRQNCNKGCFCEGPYDSPRSHCSAPIGSRPYSGANSLLFLTFFSANFDVFWAIFDVFLPANTFIKTWQILDKTWIKIWQVLAKTCIKTWQVLAKTWIRTWQVLVKTWIKTWQVLAKTWIRTWLVLAKTWIKIWRVLAKSDNS